MIDVKTCPSPDSLCLPIQPYVARGHRFGSRVRSRFVLWARHLGDDILAKAGTPIVSVGEGIVAWSETRPGYRKHPNWGGIIILCHRHKRTDEPFFSLYGHMRNLRVREGDGVVKGQRIGEVAPGLTPENGWWKLAHVHFAIYVGPMVPHILPGYARLFEGRTKFKWWRNPREFISEYNELDL